MEAKFYPNLEENYFFDHVHIYHSEQVGLHEQITWEISYIITGAGQRTMGDRIEYFSSGEVILIPPDLVHAWDFDASITDKKGKIENITLILTLSFLEKLKNTFSEFDEAITFLKNLDSAVSFKDSILKELQIVMKRMIHESEIERIASIFKILELISNREGQRVVGKAVSNDKTLVNIQKIQLYVLNHYHRPISLDEVADLVGMKRSSFCIFFKKITGKTFFTYLNNIRLDSSCEMLKKTKYNIAEIALLSGFNDIPYYNRVFKKYKACTPKEYRSRYNSN